MTECFRSAMRASGLEYTGPIVADGQLHRFKAEGDHSRNCWYVFHGDHPAAGSYGCWKRGFSASWCEKNGDQFSADKWRTTKTRWRDAEEKREQTEVERRLKAKKTAAWIWK